MFLIQRGFCRAACVWTTFNIQYENFSFFCYFVVVVEIIIFLKMKHWKKNGLLCCVFLCGFYFWIILIRNDGLFQLGFCFSGYHLHSTWQSVSYDNIMLTEVRTKVCKHGYNHYNEVSWETRVVRQSDRIYTSQQLSEIKINHLRGKTESEPTKMLAIDLHCKAKLAN